MKFKTLKLFNLGVSSSGEGRWDPWLDAILKYEKHLDQLNWPENCGAKLLSYMDLHDAVMHIKSEPYTRLLWLDLTYGMSSFLRGYYVIRLLGVNPEWLMGRKHRAHIITSEVDITSSGAIELRILAQEDEYRFVAEDISIVKVPYGRTLDNDGIIIPAPQEMVVLAKITSYKHRGLANRAIAETLNSNGLPSRFGVPWNDYRIRKATNHRTMND